MSSSDPNSPFGSGPPSKPASRGIIAGLVFFSLGALVPHALWLVGELDLAATNDFMERGGWGSYATVAAFILSLFSCLVCVVLRARGSRVPVLLPLFFGLVPWGLGLTFSSLASPEIEDILQVADSGSRATMAAVGVSDVLVPRALGLWLSGGLLMALAFGWAASLLSERAPKRFSALVLGSIGLCGAGALIMMRGLGSLYMARAFGAAGRAEPLARLSLIEADVLAWTQLERVQWMLVGAACVLFMTALFAFVARRRLGLAAWVFGAICALCIGGVFWLDRTTETRLIKLHSDSARLAWSDTEFLPTPIRGGERGRLSVFASPGVVIALKADGQIDSRAPVRDSASVVSLLRGAISRGTEHDRELVRVALEKRLSAEDLSLFLQAANEAGRAFAFCGRSSADPNALVEQGAPAWAPDLADDVACVEASVGHPGEVGAWTNVELLPNTSERALVRMAGESPEVLMLHLIGAIDPPKLLGALAVLQASTDRAPIFIRLGRPPGRVAPRPREVIIDEVALDGGLSREVVRRVLRRHQNNVELCLSEARDHGDDVGEELALHFKIGPDGAVSEHRVEGASRAFNECANEQLGGFTFPSPDGGGFVRADVTLAIRSPEY